MFVVQAKSMQEFVSDNHSEYWFACIARSSVLTYLWMQRKKSVSVVAGRLVSELIVNAPGGTMRYVCTKCSRLIHAVHREGVGARRRSDRDIGRGASHQTHIHVTRLKQRVQVADRIGNCGAPIPLYTRCLDLQLSRAQD